MELVFEMVSAQQFTRGLLTSKTFKETGGIIGRGEDCDWVIPDSRRHLSGHHAQISYRDGAFYLTDTSSNGVRLKDSGARLRRDEPQRIEHGAVYCLGEFEIRARLVQDPARFDDEIGRPRAAGSIIPDDAFLDLDPLVAIDQQERIYAENDDFSMLGKTQASTSFQADYAPIDMESLPLPQLVPAPPPAPEPAPAHVVERQPDGFWQRYGAELGVDLDTLDHDAREALALQAAHLLRQCVAGLQQSLRTRTELKNELRLALTTAQGPSGNPLKQNADSRETLATLLRGKHGQLSAELAVARAFRDIQAHQVALLSASRAAVRGTLEHFAPEQLSLRFERDGQVSRLSGASGRWRAYGRYHQSLRQDDEWSERLLARDFAQAYEEQVRLIGTLNSDSQG